MFNTKDALVEFERVSFSYNLTSDLFRHLSLSIQKGAFYFLTGPSGAGKTSFLKMIYMAISPMIGDIKIFGKSSSNMTPLEKANIRQKIGIVFQETFLINHITVLQNVALPLYIKGLSTKLANEHAYSILKWMSLDMFAEEYPSNLSGGQRQRVEIARAVVGKSSLILADEPTGNVDYENAMKIIYLFESLHKSGTTVIFATHDRSLARSFPYPEIHINNFNIEYLEGKGIQLSSKYGNKSVCM
jgi:cell division transport system ATP-binding protein